MKVQQLIAQLKKMPQNIEVFTSAHDNAEYETAGYVTQVYHYRKKDFLGVIPELGRDARECFDAQPDEWVTIHS